MADEILEQAAPEAAAPDAASDDAPLSEHQAVFGPVDPTLEGEAKAKNDEARVKARHRAASQQAGPDDVDEIKRLTARARAAERASGIERKPNESERVYEMRVRAEIAERHGKAPSPTPAPAAIPLASRATPVGPERGDSGHPQQPPPREPTRPMPKMAEIGDKYAEYEDYNVDLHKWSVEQYEAEREAKATEARQREQFDSATKEYAEDMKKAVERTAKFKETHPDFEDLLNAHAGLNLPWPVFKAVAKHDNGPAFLYHLLTHPDELTEVMMLFEGRPPSDEYVAHATRWLTSVSSRAQAAPTGSAVPAPPIALAPRPPNPVRTGPTRTSDELPGDDSPLSAHEAKWGGGRRR